MSVVKLEIIDSDYYRNKDEKLHLIVGLPDIQKRLHFLD